MLRPKKLLTLLTASVVFCLGAASASLAVVEETLPNGPLELALWKAEVNIVLREGAVGSLIGSIASGEGRVDPSAPTIVMQTVGGKHRVVRAEDSGQVRLLVEVVLDPSQSLSIVGSDLQISIRGPELPDPDDIRRLKLEAVEAGTAPNLPEPVLTDLNLTIGESSVELETVRGVKIKSRQSWINARHLAGTLELDLEGGTVRVEEHHDGSLIVRGTEAEIELNDSKIDTEWTLEGGQARIDGLRGTLNGTWTDATLVVGGWLGTAQLKAVRSVLDLHSFPQGANRMEIDSEDSTLSMRNYPTGTLVIKQQGGEFNASGVGGGVDVQAYRGARLDLKDLEGAWKLKLEDSEAKAHMTGRLDVTLIGSQFEASEISLLILLAQAGSEVTAGPIFSMPQARLEDSQGSFAMKSQGKNPEVHLFGGSRAQIDMPTPCIVSVQEGEASAVRVSGCELRLPGQKTYGQRSDIGVPSVLTLEMGPNADAEVGSFSP